MCRIDELIYFGFKNLYLHIFMEFPNSLINAKNFNRKFLAHNQCRARINALKPRVTRSKIMQLSRDAWHDVAHVERHVSTGIHIQVFVLLSYPE